MEELCKYKEKAILSETIPITLMFEKLVIQNLLRKTWQYLN